MIPASLYLRNINLTTFTLTPGTNERIRNQMFGLKERILKGAISSIIKANKDFFKPLEKLSKPPVFGLGLGPLCPSSFDCKANHHPPQLQAQTNKSEVEGSQEEPAEVTINDLEEKKPEEPPIVPQRTPKDSLKDLIYHATFMSLVLAELNPHDILLIELLHHSIIILDNALSGEFQDTCHHTLIGIKQMIQWIRKNSIMNTHSSTTEMKDFSSSPTSYKTAQFLNQLRNHESSSGTKNLKSSFLCLQLQLCSLMHLPRGRFSPSMELLDNILTEIETIFSIMKHSNQSLRNLQWEKDNSDNESGFREEYWSIFLDTLYSKRAEEPKDSTVPKSKSKDFNSSKFSSQRKDEPKSNLIFGKMLKEFLNKMNKPRSSESKEKPDANNNEENSLPPDIILRKYRQGTDLILDLGNHILQLNNTKFRFFGLNHSLNDWGQEELESLLFDILNHQIASLDLVLSLGLWDTASLLIIGMQETVGSLCTKYQTLKITPMEPVPAQVLPLLQKFRYAIRLCQETITEIGDYNSSASVGISTIKIYLMKAQLEALLVVSSFGVVPEAQLAPDLYQLLETTTTVCMIFDTKWWLKYCQLGWDWCASSVSNSTSATETSTEAQTCKEYWEIIDEFYQWSCNSH